MAFATVWALFLLNWYAVALRSRAPTAFTLIPIVHVAVGLWLAYRGFALLLNRVVVRGDSRCIQIETRPLPTRGRRTVALVNIIRFEAAPGPSVELPRGAVPWRGEGARRSWGVEAQTRDGFSIPLGLELPRDHAAYVAARLTQLVETFRAPTSAYRD